MSGGVAFLSFFTGMILAVLATIIVRFIIENVKEQSNWDANRQKFLRENLGDKKYSEYMITRNFDKLNK